MDKTVFKDSIGPIEEFSWGKFIVGGKTHTKEGDQLIGAGKDIRLIRNHISAWTERKGHKVKPDMITGIFDQDIQVLVFGIGVQGSLKVPQKTISAIKKQGIEEVLLLRTPQACQIYNKLYYEGKRVALLAHGTC
ncbi:MAG: hypothetical protein JEZ06_04425 [Anaerolineaceae bacterium]|nr:hypothetical protein [Anaerolineaceae bacterium]